MPSQSAPPTNTAAFFCLGCSHKTAPIALRERLFVNNADLSTNLARVKELFPIDECFALSTCNRLEIYGVGQLLSPQDQIRLVATLCGLDSAHDLQDLSSALYLLSHEEGIRHALSVASSMDSLVIGETQITGQFKASLDQAKSVGALGQITDRLGQVALAAAKQVRTKTEISKHPVSISHAAIDLAKKVLDRLEGRSVIVVGAGEMAEICCRYLRQNGLERLWVVNRTLESAERLTATLGFGEAHPLQDLTSLMREADLLISSTSAPHTIVRYDEARAVWRARPSRPLVCIDIAVPRDIDPKVGELEDVYLFDIDDLRQIVDENSSKRQEAKKQATVIIRQKADEFVAWMERVPEKQHLGDIHQNVHSYFREELKRSRQRGDLKGFSEPDFALIEVAMHRITQNFLNTLSRKLKQKAYAPSMLSDLFQGLLNSPTEIATEIATLESEDSSPADIPDGRASRSKKGEVS